MRQQQHGNQKKKYVNIFTNSDDGEKNKKTTEAHSKRMWLK